jgi:hypothetical protein
MFHKNSAKNYLFAWGLVFLAILIAFRTDEYKSPIVRKAIERVESFTNTSSFSDSLEEIEDMNPADDTSVKKPREPYNLLNDVLPLSTKRVSPTSQRCYESDFQTRLERGGAYRQLTNNYKRAAPDACSSPLHEFVLSYYTPPTI